MIIFWDTVYYRDLCYCFTCICVFNYGLGDDDDDDDDTLRVMCQICANSDFIFSTDDEVVKHDFFCHITHRRLVR